MKIKKGVPVPRIQHNVPVPAVQQRYVWKKLTLQMKVGDSVHVETLNQAYMMRNALIKERLKATMRGEGKGYRVWRIK